MDLDSDDVIELSTERPSIRSSNFGSGIELLMNEKRRDAVFVFEKQDIL